MPNYTLRRIVLAVGLLLVGWFAVWLAGAAVEGLARAWEAPPPYCLDLGKDSAQYLATGNEYKCNYPQSGDLSSK
jgi:hypothetical protein